MRAAVALAAVLLLACLAGPAVSQQVCLPPGGEPCPDGRPGVRCLRNPCDGSETCAAAPDATCYSFFCQSRIEYRGQTIGGPCAALFFDAECNYINCSGNASSAAVAAAVPPSSEAAAPGPGATASALAPEPAAVLQPAAAPASAPGPSSGGAESAPAATRAALPAPAPVLTAVAQPAAQPAAQASAATAPQPAPAPAPQAATTSFSRMPVQSLAAAVLAICLAAA